MVDLALRPAHNDHRVLGDLIAEGVAGWSGRGRPTFDRLILDASVAVSQVQLSKDAAAAGIPVLVDPMTYLSQYDTSGHSWSDLPFGAAEPWGRSELSTKAARRKMAEQVVEFQLTHGATMIIPPYFYCRDPRDPLFSHSLNAIRETREYLEDSGLSGYSMFPVFCGRVDSFSHPDSWPQGLDWFAQVSREEGAGSVAVQLSPVGDFSDSYAKLFYFFRSVQRMQESGLDTHVWRQGALGQALVAAGATGYETGLQYGNKTNLSSLASNRRVRETEPDRKSGGGGGQVYLSSIGRWISSRQASQVLAHPSTRDALLCDDPINCCSGGFGDTLTNRREHAVRSHSRGLARIAAMPPHVAWRMHQVAKDATDGADALMRMNKIWERAGMSVVKRDSHLALARIAETLSRKASSAA